MVANYVAPLLPSKLAMHPMKLQLRAKHLIDPTDLSEEGICKRGTGEVTCMFTSNLLKSVNISSPEEKREEMVRKIKKRQEAGDCYRQLETQNAQSWKDPAVYLTHFTDEATEAGPVKSPAQGLISNKVRASKE